MAEVKDKINNLKAKINREKIKQEAKNFRREIKKAFSTAIIAALGFLTALEWREVLMEYIEKVERFSPIQEKIFTAILVTLFSTIIIFLIVKLVPSDK